MPSTTQIIRIMYISAFETEGAHPNSSTEEASDMLKRVAPNSSTGFDCGMQAIASVRCSVPLGETPLREISLGGAPLREILLGGAPLGEAPLGEIPLGEIPLGEIPLGEIPLGEIPLGEIPLGEIPLGEISLGEAPLGEAPLGEAPLGEATLREVPLGNVRASIVGGVSEEKLAGGAKEALQYYGPIEVGDDVRGGRDQHARMQGLNANGHAMALDGPSTAVEYTGWDPADFRNFPPWCPDLAVLGLEVPLPVLQQILTRLTSTGCAILFTPWADALEYHEEVWGHIGHVILHEHHAFQLSDAARRRSFAAWSSIDTPLDRLKYSTNCLRAKGARTIIVWCKTPWIYVHEDGKDPIMYPTLIDSSATSAAGATDVFIGVYATSLARHARRNSYSRSRFNVDLAVVRALVAASTYVRDGGVLGCMPWEDELDQQVLLAEGSIRDMMRRGINIHLG